MELKTLYIEATRKTPHVDFNNVTGELIIDGKSIPENAALLYEDILNWIVEYVKYPKAITNFRLNLEYFNTASAIWLAKIVRILSSIKDENNTLIIHLSFSIEDFENMDTEEIKDELHPLIHLIGDTVISMAFKIYGTDENGNILRESKVFL